MDGTTLLIAVLFIVAIVCGTIGISRIAEGAKYKKTRAGSTSSGSSSSSRSIDEKAAKSEIIAQVKAYARDGSSIEYMYNNLDRAISAKMRAAVTSAPATPTYTRGLYEGSLADNISVLSNAQKKKNYDEAYGVYSSIQNYGAEGASNAQTLNAQIKDLIRQVPNSEKYLKMHDAIYHDRMVFITTGRLPNI